MAAPAAKGAPVDDVARAGLAKLQREDHES